MYGALPPGFGVGDLPTAFESGIAVFNSVTGNQTSVAIEVAANAIELAATFSDNLTSCDIQVKLASGTIFTTFTGVNNLRPNNLYAGFAEQRALLGGGALQFVLLNFSGTGSLSLIVRRTG
jgi:hypothetical protein